MITLVKAGSTYGTGHIFLYHKNEAFMKELLLGSSFHTSILIKKLLVQNFFHTR